jgi:probable rRNA maturation factor
MDIQNNQRKIKIEKAKYLDYSESISNVLLDAKDSDFTVAFVSNKKMSELQKQFRGKKGTTDVLSFPFEPDEFDNRNDYLGDIAISVEQAQKQALENNLNLEIEIKQLILHGVLHLCGYDHVTDNGEMNELELKLRVKLGIS